MGKVQCKSIKGFDFESMEIIEESFKNKNTPLDEKIKAEYFQIKSSLNSSKKQRIKLSEFIKWYKVAYNNEFQVEIKCQSISFSPKKCLKLSEKPLAFSQSTEDNANPSKTEKVYSCGNSYFSMDLNFSLTNKLIQTNLSAFAKECPAQFAQLVFLGPPSSLRWTSWLVCFGVPEERNEEDFFVCLKKDPDKSVKEQIKKDLSRTFAEEPEFALLDNQNRLSNVLQAFANKDIEVGYCQGMNFIAGFLLVLSDFDELSVFFALLALFSETYSESLSIRGFFLPGFPLLRLFVLQFDYYFSSLAPQLTKHFKKLEIPNEIWVFKWFQSLFTIILPLNKSMRIWDSLLSKGLSFIVNIALALVIKLEPFLLKQSDITEVIDVFRSFSPLNSSSSKSIDISIEDLIRDATKINVTHKRLTTLQSKYETETGLLLSDLKKKYEIEKTEEESVLMFEDCGLIEEHSEDDERKFENLINYELLPKRFTYKDEP